MSETRAGEEAEERGGRLRVLCCSTDGRGTSEFVEAFPAPAEIRFCSGPTLPAAYNAGVARLTDPRPDDILCFAHRDARLSFPVESALRDYLEVMERPGVLGFCGTKRQTPEGHWYTSEPRYGRLIQDDRALVFERPRSGPPGLRHEPVETLDGYCLFTTRRVFDAIGGFDESLDGWHFYDIDLCMKALAAGFVNYVIDRPSRHLSWGDSDAEWRRLRGLWLEKWRDEFFLPRPGEVHVYGLARPGDDAGAEAFVSGCAEADGAYVLDLGLSPDTAAWLRERGVSVHPATAVSGRLDLARNEALELVPADADVCVGVDLGEELTPGWRAEIERVWTPRTTRVEGRAVERLPDGWRDRTIVTTLAHARHGYRWARPVHEELARLPGLTEAAVRISATLLRRVPRDLDPSETLEGLASWIEESPDDAGALLYRAHALLALEDFAGCIEESARFLDHPGSGTPVERALACVWTAAAYRGLLDDSEVDRWLFRAVSEAPDRREPLVELSDHLARQEDFAGSYSMATAAGALADPGDHELANPYALAERPHDLAAVAAHWIGLHEEACEESMAALVLNPWNDRLVENCVLIRETGEGAGPVPGRVPGAPLVDVIVLSNSATEEEHRLTCRTISALRRSSPGFDVNVVVVETNTQVEAEPFASRPLFGPDVTVVLPDRPFSYNPFLLEGWAALADSPARYFVLLNNDVVVFSDGFLDVMTRALDTLDSASPLGLREATWSGVDPSPPIVEGYDVNVHLHGWCTMFHRRVLDVVSFETLHPERFTFWGGDIHYGRLLAEHGLRHGLVTSAKALHLGKQSHHLLGRPAWTTLAEAEEAESVG